LQRKTSFTAAPESASDNTNILVMVDQFTKWVECIALPSQTADVTARAAVNAFFARLGYPFNIFTDQGDTRIAPWSLFT
jgi:hypothetical protein